MPISSKRGLISPIIFDADKKGLAQINKEVGNLIAKAEDGSLQPFELEVSVFTRIFSSFVLTQARKGNCTITGILAQKNT